MISSCTTAKGKVNLRIAPAPYAAALPERISFAAKNSGESV
ncbi:hypothetical protein I542_0981 [Mycobacteroides abscessus 1948]|uniref:Uncharacterized protein n=1 Tax=Mycobacteroides abscessus 1948 TaxID=1299323 RepID=A0A829QDB4_9MYCO|nr:hypothetical protein I542_0981 [Mycobacteroides abscessus 1948]